MRKMRLFLLRVPQWYRERSAELWLQAAFSDIIKVRKLKTALISQDMLSAAPLTEKTPADFSESLKTAEI